MFDWFFHFFDTTGFPARWYCGSAWAEEPIVGWLHIYSDIAIFASYYAVPCVVAWFVLRKPELKFPPIFWIFFGLIFFSCGSVHLVEACIFYWPQYRVSAALKVLTAVVSSIGVVVLAKSLPGALDLKTPAQLQAEIEERRQAEAKLDFESNLLHTLMNHLPDAIYFKDRRGKYLRVNRALADKLRLDDVEQAIGRSETDVLPGQRAGEIEQDDKLVLETETAILGRIEREPWSDEDNGTWVSSSRLPLHNRHGQLVGTFGISHDITPIKRNEERLAKLAQRLALPRDEQARELQTFRIANFKLRDMITCGSDIRAMGLSHESRESLDTAIAEYLFARMKAKDGHGALTLVRVFQTTKFGDLDDERKDIARQVAGDVELTSDTCCLTLQGTAGINPAWNDRKRSKGHRVIPLTSVEAVETMPMIAQLIRQLGFDVAGILRRDTNVMMDRACTNVFHVAEAGGSEFIPAQDEFVTPNGIESVVGFGDVLPNGDLFAVICFSRESISEQTATLFSHLSISTKIALLAHERISVRVEQQIIAVDQLLQNYERVVCDQESTLHDAMTDLEHARDSANDANRAKSDFLANMSHEIRTPMNAIIGMTELVLESDLSSSDREYLTTVLDSSESLLSIINEILDFSKIEAGRVEIDPTEFDLREEVGDMIKSLAIRAHHKNLELAYEIDADVPRFVIADVAKIRQILVNLIGNAIKFTQEGEVVVRIKHVATEEDKTQLRFVVSDTGIGIAAENRKSIFDAFAQADSSTTRKYGGTGLGLAISSNLVRLMGGEIQIESTEGNGSRFYFTLQLDKGTGDQIPAQSHPQQLIGCPALLVDDNDTNLHILKRTLISWGLEPIAVNSGDEAVRVLQQRALRGERLPLVITDVHMPQMDGFQLVELIRKTEPIQSCAVIALTSGLSPGDAARCRQLKIGSQLMKPVKPSELFEAVLVGVGAAAGSVVTKSADDESTFSQSLKLLLVEDGLANQKLAIGLLERWGHTVTVAENGLIAVQRYQSMKFDAVLMDLQMPVMDGIEATKQIRAIEQEESSERIPIIAMTAHALVGDRERCLAAGMDGYVSKPIRRRDLLTELSSFFEEIGVETSADDESTGPTAESNDRIDLTAALELMEGDESILRAVVEVFVEETPRLVQQVEDSLQSTDPPTLRRAAHTLKASCNSLRLEEMRQLCETIELQAANENLQEVDGPVKTLRQQLDVIVRQLNDFLAE